MRHLWPEQIKRGACSADGWRWISADTLSAAPSSFGAAGVAGAAPEYARIMRMTMEDSQG